MLEMAAIQQPIQTSVARPTGSMAMVCCLERSPAGHPSVRQPIHPHGPVPGQRRKRDASHPNPAEHIDPRESPIKALVHTMADYEDRPHRDPVALVSHTDCDQEDQCCEHEHPLPRWTCSGGLRKWTSNARHSAHTGDRRLVRWQQSRRRT
jgi:hypothetical protein